MSNVLSYKGYHAPVEFDAGDGVFFGRLAGIDDGIGFHADNVADLRVAFREAVDDYVETCRRIGKDPQRPYSGKLMFRVAPAIHARATLAAKLAGKSLNQWGEEMLRRAVGL